MTMLEELRERARSGDLQALQALRDSGYFARRAAEEGHPVSNAQRRLWVVDKLGEGTGAYNIPIALELAGALDAAALRAAVQAIIRRHESLRTTFAMRGGTLRQFVHEEMPLPWEEIDLCGAPDTAAAARRFAADHGARGFDLARGPLLRVALLRLEVARHLFLVNIHHIVADLASLGVLAREFSACYAACAAGCPPALPPLPIQLRDAVAWQARNLADGEAASHRAYWLRHLQGPLTPLALPTDSPRPPLRTHAGRLCRVPVDPALAGGLRRLGLRYGMTLFMVLAATVKLLLHRITGQEEVILGVPLAGRDHPDLAGLIGCFVNTVALRDRLAPEDSVAVVLGRVRQTVLEAYEHQSYPFDLLVEELDLPRDMSRSPVFDVSVSLAHAEPSGLDLGEVTVVPYDGGFAAAKVDLSFDFAEVGEGLELTIIHAADLFSTERIRRMSGHFLRLAAAAAAQPEQAIGRLPLLTPEEEDRILRGFNATERSLPLVCTVLDLVERQAEHRPEGIAVRGGGRELSYGGLADRARRLAARLRRRGVGPGSLVGVFLEPTEAVPVALLGILGAGGVYLPLDPANPPLRLAAMLEDAPPYLVLTEAALADRLPERPDGTLLLADEEGTPEEAAASLSANPAADAYAIFTSGSTGRAKAVVLPHRGLLNLACEQARLFAPGPGDCVLQFAALGFDASIFEMVMALASGATLCMPGREALLPGAPLLATLEREAISIATLPPSTLATLPEAALPALRILTVAGEACSAELVRRWAPGRAFFNLYGPTEATIWASAARCGPEDASPTLGRPIGNTRLRILDRQMQLLPVGIPGELCIAGIGLARGYLNRPELTADRFVPDPFDPRPGARLYRTGDLARWREDGCVEFLGRIDQQVKLRGYRIEVGEIEAALTQHPGVGDAVVLLRGAAPGEHCLVAYATPRNPAAPPEARALRQFLRERLPDYMVPARILLLDALPLTPNKKVDYAALPDPEVMRPETSAGFVAPRDELEQAIAAWFAGLLRLERVGSVDNFFELGGDSLMATRLVSQIRDAFRADITIPQLFRAATVGELAGLLRAALPEGRADRIAAALRRLQTMSTAEKQALLQRRDDRCG